MSEKGCYNCRFQNRHPSDYPCRRCKNNMGEDNYSPMTNADRIRNMSDEELAEMLDDTYCRGQHSNCEGRTCGQCTLEWLQAEVEEGAE